jgi:hypothetical protein
VHNHNIIIINLKWVSLLAMSANMYRLNRKDRHGKESSQQRQRSDLINHK